MSDFSLPPDEVLRDARARGYSGVHIEQGVPILDRDLNLMHDLLAAVPRSIFSRYIGDGTPEGQGDGFAIRALPDGQNENNFQIMGPGTCLVQGVEAVIDSAVDYRHQPHLQSLPTDHPSLPKPLTAPSAADPDPRPDIVYLDVFAIEVANTADLENSRDVGMQTSVRVKAVWTVRVAENTVTMPTPPDGDGHAYYPLAQLLRRRDESKIVDGVLAEDKPRITDRRQRRLTVATLEARLSRLERELFAPSFTPDPSIGQIKPRFGRVNQPITLSGKNFTKGTIWVRFADVDATIVEDSPKKDDEMKVLVPGGITLDGVPKDVKITIGNEIGFAVSDRVFQVVASPVFDAQTDAQFDPQSGAPGTPVTLKGFNFTPGDPTVTFGTTKANVLPGATYNELKVEVPDGIPPNTDVKITVTFPRGPTTSTSTFKVLGN